MMVEDWPGFVNVSIARPFTKIWVCENCGAVWETLADALAPRGFDGQVLCDECNEHPMSVVIL